MRRTLILLAATTLFAQTATLPELTALKISYADVGARISAVSTAYVAQVAQSETYRARIAVLETDLAAERAKPRMSDADALKISWVDAIDARCHDCRPTIDAGMIGKSGALSSVLICCGINTVPATPAGTSLVYIFPKVTP